MKLDVLLNAVYGCDDELSSIVKRAFVPGGAIVAESRMLKREEEQDGYRNTPRRVVGLTCSTAVELVKASGYAALFYAGLYYLLK